VRTRDRIIASRCRARGDRIIASLVTARHASRAGIELGDQRQ